MAGCASRHHKWRNYHEDGAPVLGSPCVGKRNGEPCDAVYLGGPSRPAPVAAPAGEAPPLSADAGVSPENRPAPAPRATLGAALALARPSIAPGAAPAGTAAPGAAPAPPPVPNAWQRLASRKMLSALFALNDKAMELRKREPAEDAPDESDEEFREAATELSKSLAIWFPAEALPPWGNAAIITAGMLSERWIMSKPLPVEAEDARPPARVAATAAATKAPPPPPTPLAGNGAPMDAEAT